MMWRPAARANRQSAIIGDFMLHVAALVVNCLGNLRQIGPRNQDAGTAIYRDMEEKVAVMTGDSSRIGLATARAFACRKSRVAIASRRETAAKPYSNSLRQ